MHEELFGFLTSINIIPNINITNKHKYSPVQILLKAPFALLLSRQVCMITLTDQEKWI